MKEKKFNLYVLNVLATMLVIPLLSILAEMLFRKTALSVGLAGKYFVGWAIGVRLLVAGLRQTTRPRFTAEEIFHLRNADESLPIVRELGFANICLGILGTVSLFADDWRLPAALAGGLYFGFAGLLHVFRKAATFNERIAKISDLFIFGIALLYTLLTLCQTGSPAS